MTDLVGPPPVDSPPVSTLPATAPPRRRSRLRAIAAGTVSLLTVAGLVVSVSWDNVAAWQRVTPLEPVALDADGAATITGMTVSLARMEVSQEVVGPYGDVYEAPEGWSSWLLTFDVVVEEDHDVGSLEVQIVADDGKTYTRSLGTRAVDWFMFAPAESKAVQELVVMPEGVQPVLVRIVPNWPANPYWEFPAP